MAQWGMIALLGSVALVVVAAAALPREPRGNEDSSDSRAGATHERVVQHVLISFRGAAGFGRRPPLRARLRSQEEAEALATRVLRQAANQARFDSLVERYSDDMASSGARGADPSARLCADGCGPTGEAPGAYLVVPGAGAGVEGPAAELHRTLLLATEDLLPGEIALAPYDPERAPLGYHVLRRLR